MNSDYIAQKAAEFERYITAAHIDARSPLSAYCRTRAILAAIDLSEALKRNIYEIRSVCNNEKPKDI